jgi:hypothetical protein
VIDFAVVGAVGCLAFGLARSGAAGAGFLCACFWVALNTLLLAGMLESITLGRNPLVPLLLSCAKIPLSYLILFWLYRVEYLDSIGLTAGILTLPVVLGWRGSTVWRRHQVNEEGN